MPQTHNLLGTRLLTNPVGLTSLLGQAIASTVPHTTLPAKPLPRPTLSTEGLINERDKSLRRRSSKGYGGIQKGFPCLRGTEAVWRSWATDKSIYLAAQHHLHFDSRASPIRLSSPSTPHPALPPTRNQTVLTALLYDREHRVEAAAGRSRSPAFAGQARTQHTHVYARRLIERPAIPTAIFCTAINPSSIMSNQTVGAVYAQIITDVIDSSRVDFEEMGVEESVLEDLKKVSTSSDSLLLPLPSERISFPSTT